MTEAHSRYEPLAVSKVHTAWADQNIMQSRRSNTLHAFNASCATHHMRSIHACKSKKSDPDASSLHCKACSFNPSCHLMAKLSTLQCEYCVCS
jgi:hypothetical protein